MVQSRRHFKHFLSATVVLQSFGRLILMQKTLRRETNAATIIESNVRRYQVQVNFMKLKHCATRIQAHYRMHMSAKMFKKTRRASIKIQSFHRCSSAWRRRVAIKKACKVVEKHYNNLLLRREKMLKEAAVLKIQAIIRGNQARRCAERMMKFKSLQKLEAIRIKYAAMTIQQAFRQFRRSHYVRVLQRFARICGAKSFAITKRKSVVTMQSFFRAVLVRKDMPRRIKEARKRVEEAAKLAAEADRLGNRTAVALNVLLNSTNLSGVKRAIVTLEVSTRLSDICAFKFVEMGAVPIIYKLIRSCNRSEPHRAVLAYALNVLRHTSCYEKANTSEYLPPRKHRIETLLELMQTFREQPEVLRQITHLMFHLCKDRSFAKQLSLDRDVMKRLLSILRLLQRKVKHSTGVNKKKRSLEMRGVRNLERLIERINTGR
jgi:abnormal spindle-like microcephaly-associated protein